MKNMYFKKNNFRFRLLCSNLILFLIPVIVSIALIVSATSVIRTEVLNSNNILLSQVSSSFTEKIEIAEQIIIQVATNSAINSYNGAILSEPIKNYSTYTKILSELETLKNTNNFIGDIYIYYKNIDLVISTQSPMSKETAYRVFHSKDGYTFSDWNKFLQENHTMEIVGVPEKNKSNINGVAYVQTLSIKKFESNFATLYIRFDDDYINNILEKAKLDHNMVFILNRDNNLLFSNTKGEFLPQLIDTSFSDENNVFEQKINGEKYMISYYENKYAKFMVVSSNSVFWEKLIYVRFIAACSFIFLLIFGVLSIIALVKINYRPIKNLNTNILEKFELLDNHSQDAYNSILTSIEAIHNEKIKNTGILLAQKQILKSYFLKEWLNGALSKIEIENGFKKYGLNYSNANCFIILFQTLCKSNEYSYDTIYSMVENTFEQLLGEIYEPTFCSIDENTFYCILKQNTKNEINDNNELNKLLELINLKFNISFRLIISETYPIEHLYKAYNETLVYSKQIPSDSIENIFYCAQNNTIENMSQCFLNQEIAQKLINHINTGDFDNAQAILRQQLSYYYNDNTDFNTQQCIKFDILNLFMKSCTNTAEIVKIKKNLLGTISTVENPIQTQTVFFEYLKKLCMYQKEINEMSYSSVLIENIIKYINENYKDKNLSVKAISKQFNYTQQYLTQLFKGKTNITLKSYINNIRIKHAKTLLCKKRDMKIIEVASECGFENVNTFIRAFKNLEGTTPNKFKDNRNG